MMPAAEEGEELKKSFKPEALVERVAKSPYRTNSYPVSTIHMQSN